MGPRLKRATHRRSVLVALAALAAIAAALAILGASTGRGVPFVRHGEQWTIGIYQGSSPFDFSERQDWRAPVLTAEDVSDARAKFVADPFLLDGGDRWYLFFEFYDRRTRQGDLAVATAPRDDLRDWTYRRVVLDEPFHLSYPYVFRSDGNLYMIPETFETDSIRLYRAKDGVDFPYEWDFVTTLVSGRDYVDPSILHFDGHWWLFASVTSNDTLYLFESEELSRGWREHPASPIVVDDRHRARPSGRVIVHQGRPYRFAMDVAPEAGTHTVRAFEITELTRERYAEREARDRPVLAPDGHGWNRDAMHQIDVHEVAPGKWVAAVDGFGDYYVFGWNY